MGRFVIEVDDPRRDDVRSLLEQHLAFAHESTPPEDVYALGIEALVDPAITFYSLRVDGEVLAVGAIRQLDPHDAEIKSMHTAEAARRRGYGRAMVDHLLAVAADRGVRRVYLETGSAEVFSPARRLYVSAGFEPCGPFGEYEESPNLAFMTKSLG
ncbi:MAG: GNAT family N-acetyltransferase [Verrucomicrobiota bacterium]